MSDNHENLPARSDDRPSYEVASRRTALADLRDNAMSVPVEEMHGALEEYADRRAAFYRWLLSQMIEGVHYGVPPGCEPRGNVDPRQWKAKPSLYKAGADFVCDLMGLRDQYESDRLSWEMLGSPPNVFIRKCQLFSRNNGKLVGEGTGARTNGTKKMDINGSIKMADKTAKVAAIINSYGLSDLFTQDMERETFDNPEARDDAPNVGTREQRSSQSQSSARPPEVSQQEVVELGEAWLAKQADGTDKSFFFDWVVEIVGGNWNPKKTAQWTRDALAQCRTALGIG